MDKKIVVTVIGAGGKMGHRVSKNLTRMDYELNFCEVSAEGIERIKDFSTEPVASVEVVVPQSDYVVLAIPDRLIGAVSKQIVPMMKKDGCMIILDPAAAYAKELELRNDCTFMVVHPCHPALFVKQESDAAREDFFGGTAKQDVVVAMIQGREDIYEIGTEICKIMFHPVINCFKVTVDQMAMLEPIVSEVVVATCAHVMREAVDEAERRGIAREVVESFLLGHANVLLAIYFNKIPVPVSDACEIAVDRGLELIFKEDWKRIFEKEVLDEVVDSMLMKS